MKVFYALPVFLGALAVANPSTTKRQTNSERLRHGLGPLPPAKKTSGALYPRQSATYCSLSIDTGYIEVSGPGISGYVSAPVPSSSFAEGFASGYVVKDYGSAQLFQILSSTPFSGPINIVAVNAEHPAHPYLGAASYTFIFYNLSFSNTLTPGRSDYATLIETDQIAPGPSTFDAFANGVTESQIWTLDCSYQLTATWINPDSTSYPNTLFVDSNSYIYITGDLGLQGSRATAAVTFTWRPSAGQ
ncbi:hypothetical protein C8F04DRAFT_1069752 [Mycena alexandri]|uniref:Uncharacterized protein n=1 Tax=Mycena alexandri TaxID=1745969 RepID=A0AAD6XA58_9AGAR|nr:hypothetical protein C8F04DRAFT_1069752 [Mycena alexandri]